MTNFRFLASASYWSHLWLSMGQVGGAVVAQWVERWTCDQQVVGSNPTPDKSCITTLGKLFTLMCLCHQAV